MDSLGFTTGILRDEAGDNEDDLDAHCIEPNTKIKHSSTGILDVNVIFPRSMIAVENIVSMSIEWGEETYSFY